MQRIKIHLTALVVAFILFQSNELHAQCCTAGNPSSSFQSLFLSESNSLSIALHHTYSFSDTYYIGTEKQSKTYKESFFNFSSLNITYQINDGITTFLELGYFADKSEKFVDDDYIRFANGLGDINAGIVYAFPIESNFKLRQLVAVSLPVGEFNQEFDGVILPIDLQASSGNAKFKIGLSIDYSFSDIPFYVLLGSNVEFSQMLETENSYHKYGNLYDLNLLIGYPISDSFYASLSNRIEYRDKALSGSKVDNNIYSFVYASGGLLAFLSPKLSVRLPWESTLSIQFNQPIAKNVNSEQLTNKFSFTAGFSKSIRLKD